MSSRVMWGKFKKGRVKVAVIVAYAPCAEEDREDFWRDVEEIYNGIGEAYRRFVIGDLNVWVGNIVVDGIVERYGVPGINDNGRKVIDFCAGMELCIANTFYKHKLICRYTRYGVMSKSMTDFVLVKREMLRWIHDIKCMRGLSGGVSDHLIVLCRVKLDFEWTRQNRRVD